MSCLTTSLLEVVNINKGTHTFSMSTKNNSVITWDVYTFWKLVKGVEIIDLPLHSFQKLIDECISNFTTDDWLRVEETDISFPIIITGSKHNKIVLDGLHRLVKYSKYKIKTVPTQTINILPIPINIKGKAEVIKDIKYFYNDMVVE